MGSPSESALKGKSTIAVIGHGKSPVGKGWGERIDACDCVVRLWNCHWQDKPDYGAKYDYGFFEANTAYFERWVWRNRRVPEFGWIGALYDGEQPSPKLPKGTYLFNPTPFAGLAAAMGGHPFHSMHERVNLTRGAMATLWALTNADPGAQTILVGFDNVKAMCCLPVKEAFPEAYVRDPATLTLRYYLPGERGHSGHDFGIEGPMLRKVATRHEVNIAFAQDCWCDQDCDQDVGC